MALPDPALQTPAVMQMVCSETDRPSNHSHSPKDAVQGETASMADGPSSPPPAAANFNKGWRFWMIMVTLSLGMLLISLETTIVVTSLPTISAKVNLGKSFIWVSNAFILPSAAVIPLFGQLCDLFGRRNVLVFIFAAYTLGSGIAGGANGAPMLIAGRAIQGIGSGGLNVAADIVVGDLVPLRYRGNYMAVLFMAGMVGFSLGPIVGGLIVEKSSWRWVFWLNIPISGLGMLASWLFMGILKYNRQESWRTKVKRIDFVGNGILVASSVSVLIALTWAGTLYPWSDYHVLVPLIVGLAGFAGFLMFERSSIAARPVVPLRLFPSWTSRIIYVNTFLNTLLIMWCFFYFPLYFQAVRLSTPTRSGVQILPITLIATPGAVMAATVVSRLGKYKALHVAGFAIMTTGVGSIAVLNKTTSMGVWVGLQVVGAMGSGFLISTLLPAFQASTAEEDQAAATSSWAFVRQFGYIWGVAVAGSAFNSYVRHYAALIDDAAVREQLMSGDAYASATRAFAMRFAEPVRGQIQDVFAQALRKVFLISVAFGGLALLLALFEKDIPLRKTLETDYGMEEREGEDSEEKRAVV